MAPGAVARVTSSGPAAPARAPPLTPADRAPRAPPPRAAQPHAAGGVARAPRAAGPGVARRPARVARKPVHGLGRGGCGRAVAALDPRAYPAHLQQNRAARRRPAARRLECPGAAARPAARAPARRRLLRGPRRRHREPGLGGLFQPDDDEHGLCLVRRVDRAG